MYYRGNIVGVFLVWKTLASQVNLGVLYKIFTSRFPEIGGGGRCFWVSHPRFPYFRGFFEYERVEWMITKGVIGG